MHKIRKGIRWAGGIMLTIACVAAGLDFTQWSHDHPYGIHNIFICSLASAAILGVLWMLTQEDSRSPSNAQNGKQNGPSAERDVRENTAGRDVAGHQINAETVHYYAGQSRPSPQPQVPVTVQIPQAPPDAGDFSFRIFWPKVVYDLTSGYWNIAGDFDYANNPRDAIALVVERRVPPKGGSHNDITLSAIIKITGSLGTAISIPHGYWLERTYSTKDFSVGDCGHLLIGCFEGPELACYENPFARYEYNIIQNVIWPLGRRSTVGRVGKISVDVYLVDAVRRVTIARKQYDLALRRNTAPEVSEVS